MLSPMLDMSCPPDAEGDRLAPALSQPIMVAISGP